jgi:hypothetical protein
LGKNKVAWIKFMDDLKEAKDAIYNAKRITILTRDNPSQDAAGAALALFFSLKNINKIVNIPALQKFPNPTDILLEEDGQKTFLISLKKNVSEIYYEKKGEEINLYIKPKKEGIKLEDLSFKTIASRNINSFQRADQLKRPADLLIALGIENFQDIEKAIEEDPDRYLPQIKIISIDNSGLNQKYADFNLVKRLPSLSQSCAYFLKNFGPEFINSNAANALLSGVALFLKNAKPADQEELILLLSWLARNGADFSLQANEKKEFRPGPGQSLLSEALKKIEFYEESALYCSCLAKKDFKSAEASPKDLGFVVAEMKTRFSVPSLLLLWEAQAQSGPDKIIGIFYSDREDAVEKINRRLGGKRKGGGILFLSRQPDLASAKKEILDAINRQ